MECRSRDHCHVSRSVWLQCGQVAEASECSGGDHSACSVAFKPSQCHLTLKCDTMLCTVGRLQKKIFLREQSSSVACEFSFDANTQIRTAATKCHNQNKTTSSVNGSKYRNRGCVYGESAHNVVNIDIISTAWFLSPDSRSRHDRNGTNLRVSSSPAFMQCAASQRASLSLKQVTL